MSFTLKTRLRDTNISQYHTWLHSTQFNLLIKPTPIPFSFPIVRVITHHFRAEEKTNQTKNKSSSIITFDSHLKTTLIYESLKWKQICQPTKKTSSFSLLNKVEKVVKNKQTSRQKVMCSDVLRFLNVVSFCSKV